MKGLIPPHPDRLPRVRGAGDGFVAPHPTLSPPCGARETETAPLLVRRLKRRRLLAREPALKNAALPGSGSCPAREVILPRKAVLELQAFCARAAQLPRLGVHRVNKVTGSAARSCWLRA